MPREAGLGKPSCPKCKGTGWAPAAPKMIPTGKGDTFAEYPTVRVCECRGGPPEQLDGPIITDEMKLDAQSRAAGETGE